MSTDFNCTQCGQCCHNLNIPLTVNEAKAWLLRGHKLKILTEAIPWINDTPLTDDVLIRKKTMTFEGSSGKLNIRILMTLVGYFTHGCPNLDSNQRCTIYESRPLTCRIYPFEMNPKIILNPKNKLCPDAAWKTTSEDTGLITGNQLFMVDHDTQVNINKIYTQSISDVEDKKIICQSLGIKTTSLSNNGYLFHLVDPVKLLNILKTITPSIKADSQERTEMIDWVIYTQKEETLNDLISLGSHASIPDQYKSDQEEYIPL